MDAILRLVRRLGLGGLFAAMVGGCAPVDILNATVPGDGYRLVRDLAYGDLPRQKLDLYLPTAPMPGRPVVVFFYGGSWNSGARGDYLFVAQALASRGIAVAVPDYRLYPDVVFPAFLQDGAAAVRWVRDHAAGQGADPARLFLMGHSAGAYNAAMLALDRRWLAAAGVPDGAVRGLIGLAGPYDFLPLDGPATQRTFGAAPDLEATQPINFARPDAPPALLLHGDADDTVRVANATSLAAKLRAAGAVAGTKFYPGLGHVGLVTAFADVFRRRAPVLDDAAAFVAAH